MSTNYLPSYCKKKTENIEKVLTNSLFTEGKVCIRLSAVMCERISKYAVSNENHVAQTYLPMQTVSF